MVILESAHYKGQPRETKPKQDGLRLKSGMGTPSGRMTSHPGFSRTVPVMKVHPGKPLSPRETRTVGHPT